MHAKRKTIVADETERRTAPARHGVAMVLVLFAVGVATLLSMSFLNTQVNSTAVMQNVTDQAAARAIAESGLRMVYAHVQTNESWRKDRTPGTWINSHNIAGGTVTVSVEDGIDTDGDGTPDGDTDLRDDVYDPITITSVGSFQGVSHRVSAVVTPSVAAVGKALLLVPNATNLSPRDADKKSTIESWGYTVDTIAASASQPQMDAAAADADVAYVSETINSGNLNTKLTGATIGVLYDEVYLNDEFGVAPGASSYLATQINVVNNAHHITSPLTTGVLSAFATSAVLSGATGGLADGAAVLAQRVGSATPALIAVDAGGALFGGSRSAGRRVMLPWGRDAFDSALMTSEALLITKRALSWAAEPVRPGRPIARWMLDETTGVVAADVVGRNDGRYNNAVMLGQVGVFATAAQFDGSDDHVSVPHVDQYLLDGGSVSLWFRANNAMATAGLVSKDSKDNDTGGHLTIYLSNGALRASTAATRSRRSGWFRWASGTTRCSLSAPTAWPCT